MIYFIEITKVSVDCLRDLSYEISKLQLLYIVGFRMAKNESRSVRNSKNTFNSSRVSEETQLSCRYS